ncbi:MAG TPA: transcriptional regulator, partial [Xanthobacteraceae bacterium]|nr:transcriptional regulator [Xanthobacteraceae bacterium]
PIRIDETMRKARMCYDHIAGELGVALADALQAHHHIELADDGGVVTESGEAFFHRLGVDLTAARGARRAFCRPCVDWSERRTHIAGAVGAALARRLIELRWIARKRDGRALTITPIGWSKISETFGCSLHEHAPRPALRLVAG